MVVALVSLAALWDWGSPTSMENVVGTHPDRITSLAIAEDGRWVASGDYHGSVVIWDPLRRQMERVLEGSDGPVYCLAGSPDGSLLAAARYDGTVTLWDTRSWVVHRKLTADSRGLRCVAFSPDGSLLASGGLDCAITLWDTTTWRPRSVLHGHGAMVNGLRFTPDGRTLASSSMDQTVRLWNVPSSLADGTVGPILADKKHSARFCAFSFDDQTLATLSFGGKLASWDVSDGKKRTPLGDPTDHYSSLALSPDGRTLAGGTIRGEIVLLELGTRQRRPVLHAHSGPIVIMIFDAKGQVLVSGEYDGTVRVWYPSRPETS
jgi:WD40 repeat protein